MKGVEGINRIKVRTWKSTFIIYSAIEQKQLAIILLLIIKIGLLYEVWSRHGVIFSL